MSEQGARYIVGIDLGTTHTVVACAAIGDDPRNATTRLFEIEQLVGAGEVAKKPCLPSFRYHPAGAELSDGDLVLPWRQTMAGELDRVVIGEWARELGSRVEGRLVNSAKSWLSHPQVDRGAPILPWAAVEDVDKVSPVLASASYLHHVRQAWNHEHPNDLLEHQQVVITIPASFDEIARSLTVEAADLAGLPDILLLEEPQAVCYDWYARHQDNAEELLQAIQLLLVCDVGGGTTDLSLIQVTNGRGKPELTRLGVGDHLMLGGDNVDLALAHRAEQRIVGAGTKLSAASLSQLVQQTRSAKERLLSNTAPDKATVTVLGSGTRLIGGAKSAELSRNEVAELALEGFFPVVPLATTPGKRQGAMVEFGLPYAADPAISKHIAKFVQRHQGVCRQALGLVEDDHQTATPDAILFNGGVFNSELLRDRTLAIISEWAQTPVIQLDNRHPDQAVAFGAVAYGLARRGAYIKIGGGSARSYFLLMDGDGEQQGICLLPRGSEEEAELLLREQRFALRLGQPVKFHLVSSTSDRQYQPGEITAIDSDELVFLPPLMAALEHGSEGATEVEVQLVSKLTEVGTIQVQCVSTADEGQRWNVEFQIRKDLARQLHGVEPHTEQLPPRFHAAREIILAVFGQSKKNPDPKAINRLRHDLEKLLGKRDTWNPVLLRAIFDLIIETRQRRRRSAAHERIWFNLAGYAVRPGFGCELDDWRVQQLWPLYQQGLQFSSDKQCWSEWWIFWRRAAGGLDQAQQLRIYRDIARYINPSAQRNRKLLADMNKKSYEDMVRLIAALEHLPVESKVEVGEWLRKRLEKPSETPTSWWALGRVGSRVPFHGSAHNVVGSETIHQWLVPLLKMDWKKNPGAAFCAVMLARKCGDRTRDIDDSQRRAVINKLQSSKSPGSWVAMVAEVTQLDAAATRRVFGEALPSGLVIIEPDNDGIGI